MQDMNIGPTGGDLDLCVEGDAFGKGQWGAALGCAGFAPVEEP